MPKVVRDEDILGTCKACWATKESCPSLDADTIRRNCKVHDQLVAVAYNPSYPLGTDWHQRYQHGLEADRAVVIDSGNLEALDTENEKKRQERAAKASERYKETSVPCTPIGNDWGIEVAETAGGRYRIYGYSVTRLIAWAATKQWTPEDVITLLTRIGVSRINEASITTLLKYGEAQPAELTEEQEQAILKVVEKVAISPVVTKQRPKPKPKG